MKNALPALLTAFASLFFACAAHPPKKPLDAEVRELVERSKASNVALLSGDGTRYGELVNHTEDFTLMSPFGGKPSQGRPTKARIDEIARFFKNGTIEQEVVHTWASPDMIVLAIIEHAHVEAGDIPMQDWALRVTLVYQRDGASWRLAHRHADPLANGISVPESAVLARGEHR